MFKFLKNIMSNEKQAVNKDVNSVHRIFKTTINKDPNDQEDEIIFGCGCFGELRNVFGNYQELLQRL